MNTNEPAFPNLSIGQTQCRGMTLLDYFAAKAMEGAMAATDFSWEDLDASSRQMYKIASAMMRAREEK